MSETMVTNAPAGAVEKPFVFGAMPFAPLCDNNCGERSVLSFDSRMFCLHCWEQVQRQLRAAEAAEARRKHRAITIARWKDRVATAGALGILLGGLAWFWWQVTVAIIEWLRG